MMWQATLEFFQSIHFQHSGWLWAWGFSMLGIGLLLRGQRLGALAQLPEWTGARRYRHPRLSLLRRLAAHPVATQAARAIGLRWGHYAVLLLCFHVALAQPYRWGQQLPKPPEYRDTVFVIDTSLSMVLRDYLVAGERTQRMTILKSVLTHFIEQLKGNRIGLVVFSEQAYTLAPLTADYTLLKSLVRRLDAAVLTGRTSDVGTGLLYTLSQLQQGETAHNSQKPALVLITDVDRSLRDVDPRAIAAYLHTQGYRLYTVGIGASSTEAEEKDAQGLVYHPVNFSLLEEIAQRGGGQFFWADNVVRLQAAITAIQSAERQPLKAEPRYVTIPLYQWPLLAGLTWLLALQLWASWGRRA